MAKFLPVLVLILMLIPVAYAIEESGRVISSTDRYKTSLPQWNDTTYYGVNPLTGDAWWYKNNYGYSVERVFYEGDILYFTAQHPDSSKPDVRVYRIVFHPNNDYKYSMQKRDFSTYPSETWVEVGSGQVDNLIENTLYYDRANGFSIWTEQDDAGGKKGIYVHGMGFAAGDYGNQLVNAGLSSFLGWVNGQIGTDATRRASANTVNESAKRLIAMEFDCDKDGRIIMTDLLIGKSYEYKYEAMPNDSQKCVRGFPLLPGDYTAQYIVPVDRQFEMSPKKFTVYSDDTKNGTVVLELHRKGTNLPAGNIMVPFADWIPQMKGKVSNPIAEINNNLKVTEFGTDREILHEPSGESFIILKDVKIGAKYVLNVASIKVGDRYIRAASGITDIITENNLIGGAN